MPISNDKRTIVEAVGLTKIFNDFWFRPKARAVDGVDFEIHSDEIFGLLGPNGSGKSTIIKMILGLLHKTRGRLSVFGKPPSDVTIKKRIGFLPEESYMYRFLNPKETLDYYGKLFGLDHRARRQRTEELLDMVGLQQVGYRPVGEFSKGMTRRLGIAQALINDPDFLILDEPTAGLDPIGTHQVKDLILGLGRRGKTILLSSHLLADVEDVCDRMVILYGGKIRAQGTSEDLLLDADHTIIRTARLQTETISRLEQILQETEGASIDSVQMPRQRLEDLFMTIVEQARQEQIETSGALQGGQTPEFLRGETAEGEELIDTLMQEQQPEQRAHVATAPASEQTTGQQREEVLTELLEPEQETEQPATTPTRPPTEAPADVDSSVIDDLLNENEGNTDKDKKT